MAFLTIAEYYEKIYKVLRMTKLKYDMMIRTSSEGNNIEIVVIENMPKTMLFLGFPHPNEPIAQIIMPEVIHVAEGVESVDNKGKWLLVLCWDIDGALENEKWWSQELLLSNMTKHWYKPAPGQQVEWTFPLQTEYYSFDQPLVETKQIMEMIEAYQPEVLFSLHNGFLGKMYTLISPHCVEKKGLFSQILNDSNLELLDELPIPYVSKYGVGIFSQPHAATEIEYILATDENYNAFYNNGAASFEYYDDIPSVILEFPLFDLEVDTDHIQHTVSYFSKKKWHFWEEFQKDLHRILSCETSGNKFLSYPKYFYSRSISDTEMMKRLMNEFNNFEIGDLKAYISYLFLLLTQYHQIVKAGVEFESENFLNLEDELGSMDISICFEDSSKVKRTMRSILLAMLEGK